MSKPPGSPIKISDEKLDRFSFVRAYQTSAQQSRTTTQDQIKNVPSGSSATKSKCSVSRCIGLELLILLLLLVLAALIIPIVVIVLACSVTYSQTLTYGVAPTTQCTAWSAFATSLTCSSYSLMRMYGSNDPTGITVDSSSVATALALALRYNFTYGTTYNGLTWKVGACGPGSYEISATGTICSCPTGYTIRPCIGSSSWGGINSATCGAATQIVSLHFE
ncbi:unnamed protein product [Adineta steineri]|uniref:Uncharacterized protein n=1 Tax=Adineta steineri TaxID=433720 RepID=A0A814JH13_9BILA|nr:unnamed protein product [Adineta steineri]CAF1120577.1 unnamed protein product [Adineta steineri]CAF3492829.1 unnamed protein product [Adineta steineri]CAF3685422.1 unnamed protein product [Adineta steineri]